MNLIESASKLLGKIPGIGLRSGRRIALFLLKNRSTLLVPLIANLTDLQNKITKCKCGNLDDKDPCYICSSDTRDRDTVCVVDSIQGLWAVERSKEFNGTYHVLDGLLSPINGIGVAELNLQSLQNRIAKNQVQEVILVLNSSTEGCATMEYIKAVLQSSVKCSSPRIGIPMGCDLDYIDDNTISAAFRGRN